MLYRLRLETGTTDPASSGSLITPESKTIHISSDEFHLKPLSTWTSPASNAVYPISWRLILPGHQLELNVVPYVEAQELVTKDSTQITYWEGAVRVHGQGYMELTGYTEPLNERF